MWDSFWFWSYLGAVIGYCIMFLGCLRMIAALRRSTKLLKDYHCLFDQYVEMLSVLKGEDEMETWEGDDVVDEATREIPTWQSRVITPDEENWNAPNNW
jgi:hypothetical protein